METKVMNNAKKMGVADRVKLVGAVSEEDKYWYYKHCEAFVFPSYAEGFGLPVVEAMYHEKPVFTANTTSLPEVGGDAAYYFTQFDPDYMRQVFTAGMEDYLLPGSTAKIKQQALRFSWDISANEYIAIYKRLLNYIF